jgi:GT2 family glycosyltransferase
MKKLTISLVTYNSERYVRDMADSFQAQTYKDWDLLVLDNNSGDATVALVHEHLPQARVSVQQTNYGFARAHNLNIVWSSSEYVVIANPDVVLQPRCIEYLMKTLDEHPEVGSVGPKLLSWNVEEHVLIDTIDSAGLTIARNYRVRDRWQGEPDMTFPTEYVFGCTGALVMYRREALESAKVPIRGKPHQFEYFDEQFFMYKEDVDLAWRMRLMGWQHMIVPEAVAYHRRTLKQDNASRRMRKLRSTMNFYSYRNHLCMIYKNQHWSLTIRHLLPIMVYELSKFLYLATMDRTSFKGVREFLRLWPVMRAKRVYIRAHRQAQPHEIQQWLQ